MEIDCIDRGDLWKYKFRALQLRIRDRFRVTVDKHRHRHRYPTSSDGYVSMKIERWVNQFRHLRRRDSSVKPTSVFYRKRVNKDDAREDSIMVRVLQAVAVPVIGNVCHVFMHGLNHIQVFGAEKLHGALLFRPEGKPLITVSNHVASVDDPLVIASLLPPSVMLDARSLRWTLCATDRCFRNPVTSAFFRSVKVLPVSRGDGIYQKGMDIALSKLNKGGWVHIFPEGSRSRDGGKTIGSSKRGIGRLVLDADEIPVVVPFVHTGMQDIMPVGASFPRIGKTVTVLIGDPINFDDLLKVDNDQLSRGTLYDAISSRIGKRLHDLKVQVDRLALEHSLQVQEYYTSKILERATGIIQQVDWEAFGMGNYILGEEDSSSLKLATQNRPQQLNFDQEAREQPGRQNLGMMASLFEGGIVSRIRGYMDPTTLMGFAARGLFINCKIQKESNIYSREVGLL